MTDISAFRSVQGTTGYVQHRQSEPTELKKVGTFPFLGKLVAHFPSSDQKEQNRAIKVEFLNSLEKTYGKEFRQIAQAKIDVNSGKPLERRVVRDLIKQGDDRKLSELLPSKTFELRPGTEQSMKLTGSVYTDRQQMKEGAQRFLDSGCLKGGSNILSDMANIVNSSPISGTPTSLYTELPRRLEFHDKYGLGGDKLLDAFTKGPSHEDVKAALDSLGRLSDFENPNALRKAYFKAFGFSPEDQTKFNHPAAKQPERLVANLSQVFGQLGLSLGNLHKQAVDGNINAFWNQARELVSTAQDTLDRFYVGAQVLTSHEFLQSVPPEHRETMRAFGEQYRAVYEALTDPKGRFQEMLAYCSECVENPTEQMNNLRGPEQTRLFEIEGDLKAYVNTLQSSDPQRPPSPKLLPNVILPPGMELTREKDHVSGLLHHQIDESLFREELKQGDLKTDEGNTKGVSRTFEADLNRTTTTVMTRSGPVVLPGNPEQARNVLVDFSLPDQTELLHLSKFLNQEIFLSMMGAVGKSLGVVTGQEPEEPISKMTFQFRRPPNDGKVQFTEVRQDDDNYYIDYALRGELNALVFGGGDHGLQLDNGLGSTGEVTMQIKISKEELRRGGSEFEITEPLTVDIQAKIDPNRTSILD